MNPKGSSGYEWHPQIHSEVGRSSLCFWRISFSPTYNTELVVNGISTTLERFGISSFVALEVLGDFDVILKVWLPDDVRAEEVDDALYTGLPGYLVGDYLEVVEVLWDSRFDQPGEERLLLPPDLADANTRIELQSLSKVVESSHGPAPLAIGQIRDELRTSLQNALESKFIAESDREAGIDFIGLVSQPLGRLSRPGQERMDNSILQLVIGSGPDRPVELKNAALYRVRGFGIYIITGRLRLEEFYGGIDYLVQGVNTLGVDEYRFRLYTYVTATPRPLMQREALDVPDLHAPDSDLEELLSEPENETLELKATAFASIRSVIDHEQPEFSRDRSIAATISKTVCAFLNGDRRSALVVGVLERIAYLGSDLDAVSSRSSRGYESIESRAAAETRLVKSFPSFNEDLFICGIEPDFDIISRPDSDTWQQAVQTLLKNSIEPNPLPWVSFTFSVVSDRTVALIRVRPNAQGWSYARHRDKSGTESWRFYVREGNTSVEYEGTMLDDYRKRDPLRGG